MEAMEQEVEDKVQELVAQRTLMMQVGEDGGGGGAAGAKRMQFGYHIKLDISIEVQELARYLHKQEDMYQHTDKGGRADGRRRVEVVKIVSNNNVLPLVVGAGTASSA